MDLAARIEASSIPEPNSGCALWLGGCTGNGYGAIGGRPAHVVAWEISQGPVPDGLELDHKCATKTCVNVLHLEPVTHAENVRRWSARLTTCRRGHPIEANRYARRDGYRDCRECHRLNEADRRARQRVTVATSHKDV